MKKHGTVSKIGIAGVTLFLSACNAQELQDAIQQAASNTTAASYTGATSSTPSADSGNCSYTVSATYALNVNPSNDFVVHSVNASETVDESNCEGVSAGESKTVVVSSVSRHSEQVRIHDDLNLEALTANGTNLTEAAYSGCDGLYQVSFTLNSGSIDTSSELLRANITVVFTNDGSCESVASSNSRNN